MALKPVDPIGLMLLNDIVYLSWVIQRERRATAWIIKLKQREARSSESRMQSARANYLREGAIAAAEAANPSMFKRKNPEPVKKEEDSELLLAEAYMIGGCDIDIIDRRIASYEARRNTALRELDRHNETMARKLKASLEIIEGDFTEE
jgi:hypothetical protein